MEGRCTAGADAHFQGFLEVALGRFETGQEPSDHAVAGAEAAYRWVGDEIGGLVGA